MNYWIAIGNEKRGPFDLETVRSLHLSAETLVWREGLATWQRVDTLPEFAADYGSQAAESYTETAPSAAAATAPARTYTAPQADMRQQQQTVPDMPPSYLGWSIAALILCCMIPAIVALANSLNVSSRYVAGDFEGSRKASQRAELWLIISIVAGLVTAPFYILFQLMTA